MTDEELIEQLRGEPTWGGLVALTNQAADRIEALTAKLAKAVEALEVYACGPECVNGKCYDTGGSCGQFAADTLAEIKRESHD